MAQLSQSKERKKRREGKRKTSKTVPDGRAALLCLWPYTTLFLAYSTPTIGLLLFWEPVTSWCQTSFAFLPGRPFLQRSLRLSPLPSPDAQVTPSEWGPMAPTLKVTNCSQLTCDILSPSLHFSFSISLSIIWHAAYFLIYALIFCPNPLECKNYADRDFCESYLLLYPQRLFLISLTIVFSLWTVIGMSCFSNI